VPRLQVNAVLDNPETHLAEQRGVFLLAQQRRQNDGD